VGSSAGGMRPKALILWNRKEDTIRSAFAAPAAGDEPWMIKFDGVGELHPEDRSPRPFNRIEHVYSRMAREAGLEVAETRLLEEREFAHLLVRRFDRVGEERFHLHSLGGLHHVDFNVPHLFSYEQFLRALLALRLDYPALEEGFRRAVFNAAAVNQDDHVKNISFLMSENGAWRLAPAYDLTYAKGTGFTRTHQMTLNGKVGGFTREDLLGLGGAMGIRRDGADIIKQVQDALGHWGDYGAEAGIPAPRIAAIQSQFPAW
jgi:serine/threonine-protein kinase HipA